MKQAFVEIAFKAPTLRLIAQATVIIEEYQEQGFTLTLRQLYYQLVARGLRENTVRSYDRLGSTINDGRLAGLIDWDAIEDRGRNLEKEIHFDGPLDGVQSLRNQYGIDMWKNQELRVEVWIEKEALVGVIAEVCAEHDVPYLACKGYLSQSEMYAAYQRAHDNAIENQQPTIVLHLGDHDPSGIDMTRDNQDRLNLFFSSHEVVEVRRLALNMDQVDELQPPPNPAKSKDPRFKEYAEEHGTKSWELDALEPSYMVELIGTEILLHRDEGAWIQMEAELESHQERLDDVIDELTED